MPEQDLNLDDDPMQPRAVLIVSAPDLDTAKLTLDLGLEPIHTWAEGDADSDLEDAAEQPGWVFALEPDQVELDAEQHLLNLIDVLEPKGDVLRAVVTGGGHAVIDLQWLCNIDGTSNPVLQPETLRRLGALGVMVDLSPVFDNDFFFGAGLDEDWEFDDEEKPSNGKQ
ncbi:MAG TPA: DUF4279 domain-containing protein [Fimbriimonadaceae bacterium]|nr:DUF4279 domain-containing protein [Fimbriimonadaceae bacterium]